MKGGGVSEGEALVKTRESSHHVEEQLPWTMERLQRQIWPYSTLRSKLESCVMG